MWLSPQKPQSGDKPQTSLTDLILINTSIKHTENLNDTNPNPTMANRRFLLTLSRHYTCTLSPNPSLHFLKTIPHLLNLDLPHALHTLAPKCPHISTILTRNFHSQFSITRHFSSDQRDNTDNDEEEDDEDEDEYEGSCDDESVSPSNSGHARIYSPEEKEEEANAIGYKVIGPLERSDRVFKPYEPVFAVVQV